MSPPERSAQRAYRAMPPIVRRYSVGFIGSTTWRAPSSWTGLQTCIWTGLRTGIWTGLQRIDLGRGLILALGANFARGIDFARRGCAPPMWAASGASYTTAAPAAREVRVATEIRDLRMDPVLDDRCARVSFLHDGAARRLCLELQRARISRRAAQAVTVISGSSPVAHMQLGKRRRLDPMTVTAAAELLNTATPTTMVNREDIARTPGADRSNSLAMITDFVPGAYVVHDQLHVRGGHQTTWAVDGVEIPNTNIASNLGPQIDPKDIDYLEVQRGSYQAGSGRSHLWRIQCGAAHRLRTRQPGANWSPAAAILWADQRLPERRQPYGAIRLLCQRERQSQRSWHCDAGGADHSRRARRLWRVQHADIQCHAGRPAALRLFRAPRRLRNPEHAGPAGG